MLFTIICLHNFWEIAENMYLLQSIGFVIKIFFLYFVENSDNGLTFDSANSNYMKVVSITPHVYDTFAAMCPS